MKQGIFAGQWPQQVNTLYQEEAAQLRFMKRLQWALTNYLIAILAGILWVDQLMPASLGWWHCNVYLVIWTAAIITGALLCRVQHDMIAPRNRLRRITREYFDATYIEEGSVHIRRKGFWYGWPFFAPLLAVVISAAIIATIAVWVSPPSSAPSAS